MFCEYVAAFRDLEAAAGACHDNEPALAAKTLMNRMAIIRYLQSSKTLLAGFAGLAQPSRLAVALVACAAYGNVLRRFMWR